MADQLKTLSSIVGTFAASYSTTPRQLRNLDAFSLAAAATGAILFFYAKLVGSFPFNAFLAGLFASVGSFVLTVGLRMQVDPSNKEGRPLEQAFAGYAFSMITLFLAAWNYIG